MSTRSDDLFPPSRCILDSLPSTCAVRVKFMINMALLHSELKNIHGLNNGYLSGQKKSCDCSSPSGGILVVAPLRAKAATFPDFPISIRSFVHIRSTIQQKENLLSLTRYSSARLREPKPITSTAAQFSAFHRRVAVSFLRLGCFTSTGTDREMRNSYQ